MTVDFTEENFSIDFDEQNNVVEIRYQGVNAALLATLSAQLADLEDELDSALSGYSGALGMLSTQLSSLSTLITSVGTDLAAEAAARLLGDTTLGDNLTAATDQLASDLQDEIDARTAAIIAEAVARDAAIISATGTIITDLANLATTVTGVASGLSGAQASLITLSEALTTEQEARAAQYTALQADFDDTNAAVLNETVARADGDDALAAQIEVLAATSGSTVFLQDDEPTEGMVSGDIWYDTDDGNKPYRYDGTDWLDVTDVRIINNAAAIVTEAAARVSADSALSDLITALTATVTTNTTNIGTNTTNISTVSAAVTAEASARASADGALSSTISTVSASLSTEISNREDGDDALADDISTVSAAVTAEATARANADGVIEAKYSVKVDANGHVAGFGLIATDNDGEVVSEFVVTADSFKVFNGEDTDIAPFVVTGGVVYADGMVVRDGVRSGKTAYGSGTGWLLEYNGGTPRMDIGNTANYMRWSGTALEVAGSLNLTNTVQTFAPTFTGYTTPPSGNLSYLDLGRIVIMWAEANLVGYNTSASISITNVPVAIRPSVVRIAPVILMDDGSYVDGSAAILTNGTMNLMLGTVATYGGKDKLVHNAGQFLIPSGPFPNPGGIPQGAVIIYSK